MKILHWCHLQFSRKKFHHHPLTNFQDELRSISEVLLMLLDVFAFQ